MSTITSRKDFIIPIAIITTLGLLFMANISFAANTYSADFEASNSEYFSITDASQTGLDITGDMTVEAWVKFEALPTSGTSMEIATKYGAAGQRSYRLIVENQSGSQKIGMVTSANGTDVSTGFIDASLQVGEWTHLVWVYDASAGQLEAFVNAVSVGTASGLNTSLHNGTADFRIGRYEGGSYLDGKLDDVRVWSDVRTSTEIANNYQSELAGTEGNLVGYWKLENGATDETSNNNDLTNNNTVTFTNDIPFVGVSASAVLKSRKSADETVTSSTTLQDDDDLQANVSANTNYIVDGVIFVESASSDPDIKIGFDVPTGATLDIGYIAAFSNNRSRGELLETDGGASAEIPVRRNNQTTIIRVAGSVEIAGTAGDVKLQWAQSNSDTDGTKVLEGSYLRLEEI